MWGNAKSLLCNKKEFAWGDAKLRRGDFVQGVLVREPGGSIGTNFGSKAHSDF